MFENMLCFGVYFERILKIKWLFSYRKNYSLVTRIYGALGAHVTRENYKKYSAVWTCLVYI